MRAVPDRAGGGRRGRCRGEYRDHRRDARLAAAALARNPVLRHLPLALAGDRARCRYHRSGFGRIPGPPAGDRAVDHAGGSFLALDRGADHAPRRVRSAARLPRLPGRVTDRGPALTDARPAGHDSGSGPDGRVHRGVRRPARAGRADAAAADRGGLAGQRGLPDQRASGNAVTAGARTSRAGTASTESSRTGTASTESSRTGTASTESSRTGTASTESSRTGTASTESS